MATILTMFTISGIKGIARIEYILKKNTKRSSGMMCVLNTSHRQLSYQSQLVINRHELFLIVLMTSDAHNFFETRAVV